MQSTTQPTASPPCAARRTSAILQALLVTFLWATSWVLIKLGLQASLPALTFAGLRYTLAFLCLLPLALARPANRQALRALRPADWGPLLLLGVIYYAMTQGAQFVGLAYLPAATLTLLLNFTPLVVAALSLSRGGERPSAGQWAGILVSGVGALIYFLPLHLPGGQTFGLAVAGVGLLTNAWGALLGRRVNQTSGLSPLLVTTISMGVGGLLLLGAGAAFQGFGELDGRQALIIAWLAVVNTAAAFTLWNHTLRTLTAVESSILNGLMLPQIALLAWLFLGEPLTGRQIVGLALVAAGTLAVQLLRRA
jgi:drug/metabolite transporter (DMT)-like permease